MASYPYYNLNNNDQSTTKCGTVPPSASTRQPLDSGCRSDGLAEDSLDPTSRHPQPPDEHDQHESQTQEQDRHKSDSGPDPADRSGDVTSATVPHIGGQALGAGL